MFRCRRAMRLALVIAFTLFSACQGLFANDVDPVKMRHGWVTLSDKWEFYRMKLHQPYDFYPNPRGIPNAKVTLPYTFGKGVYYGTFHYHLKGLVPNRYYATELYGAIVSCSRFWCNGKLVATSGFLSKDKHSAKSGDCSEVIDLPADSDGVLDIVIHVADFENCGGIVKPIRITEKQNALRFFHLNYYLNMAVLVFLLAHIIYNITLSFLSYKRHSHALLIAICLLLAASTELTGISLTQRFLPQIPYWLHRRLPITLLCFESAMVILFETSLFKTSYRKIFILHSISGLNALATLFVSQSAFETLKPFFAEIAIATSLLSLAIPTQFILKKRPGEKTPSMQNLLLRNARAFAILIIIAMCVIDFLVMPQTETTIHPYIGFKISILLFGTIECVMYAFNRDWTIVRVTRYSEDLANDNEILSRFVSDRVLKLMGANDITRIIPGECRIIDALILCARIKHYDQLSESLERKELFSIVSDFYKSISPIILDSGGFVAKHTVGGCIALFVEKNSDAIICASRAQKKLKELRRRLRRNNKTDIGVGISIHSGKVAIGTMGTSYRLDTAVISDDINLARAVAKQTSKMNSQILITEEAMPYCRSYIDYMYEGHFFILNGRQILVYSALPIVKRETAYEETLEAIDDDEDLDEL